MTNKHNLKTEKYGEWYRDKSQHSNKEIDSFRYYSDIIPVLQAIMNNEVVSKG
ncbi:MAG: hypothetical protein FWG63_02960 [Defluviitaleaceae bacterium]|nr:hypothetical protein [Defluviitaleaceae bacterium]